MKFAVSGTRLDITVREDGYQVSSQICIEPGSRPTSNDIIKELDRLTKLYYSVLKFTTEDISFPFVIIIKKDGDKVLARNPFKVTEPVVKPEERIINILIKHKMDPLVRLVNDNNSYLKEILSHSYEIDKQPEILEAMNLIDNL